MREASSKLSSEIFQFLAMDIRYCDGLLEFRRFQANRRASREIEGCCSEVSCRLAPTPPYPLTQRREYQAIPPLETFVDPKP